MNTLNKNKRFTLGKIIQTNQLNSCKHKISKVITANQRYNIHIEILKETRLQEASKIKLILINYFKKMIKKERSKI
jgi:hypothetical protein